MLTTKKRGARGPAALLTLCTAFWFIGCTPAGPRALLEGERLLREGEPARAVQRLERAQRLLPQDARAWSFLGLAYHRSGRLEEAAHAYRQAVTLDPELAAARFNFGCLALEQNDPDTAIRELTACLALLPAFETAWAKLGTAQLRTGQTEAAEKSFRRALELDRRLPEAWNGLGLVHHQRRRYADAFQSFDAASQLDPEYAAALINAAVVAHRHMDNRNVALAKYQAALSRSTSPTEQAALQSAVQQLENELRPAPPTAPAPAVAAKPKPTPPDPQPPASRQVDPAVAAAAPATPRATAPRVTQPSPTADTTPAAPTPQPAPPPAPPKAATAPAETITPAPAPIQPPVQKERELARLASPPPTEPEPEESRSAGPRYRYRSLGVLAAGDRAAAERLVADGLHLHDRNRMSEAMELYRQAARTDPTFFDAHYNLGVAAYEDGDLPAALLAYETALALEPASLKAGFNFAIALELAGYPRDAANELEKLLARHPAETRIHLRLGNLYAGPLRNVQRTRQHYLRVLELDPRHPQASAIRFWLEANR
jgi:tetratricopeptide (TPR) repeat protein